MNERPQFTPLYHVGIEQVDREHRQIFEIAGRVFDCLSASNAAAVAQTRAAIDELLNYTATHFTSEESLMESAGYPNLEAHKVLHHRLMLRAKDMEMQGEFDENYLPVELNQFIGNWLTNHIKVEDKKFGEFMAARN